ncbi:MAG: D-Ala-D-Ala carboxypeptidase family metallohydrolase [Candidatus Methanomethylicaceae archaeon]
MGDLTAHFSMREFRCKHGAPSPGDSTWDNIRKVATMLEVLRGYIASPIIVVSGFRCPACNRACNGARKSQHLVGKAADVFSPGVSIEELAAALETLISHSEISPGGIGLYKRGRHEQRPFVHYDIRGYNVRWSRK